MFLCLDGYYVSWHVTLEPYIMNYVYHGALLAFLLGIGLP